MKLAILGGGGFRVPLVFSALVGDDATIDTVSLYDTSAERLAVIVHVLEQIRPSGHPIRIEPTTVLDEALAGASFVFSAVRVGGTAGRAADEHAALDLGVLGQETTGPGGIAYALRTIPVAMHVAERVAAVCPTAYVINFTNPAGMITEAMQTVLGDRVIGICDTPSGLGRRLAELHGVEPARVHLDYVGLNHLGWLRHATVDGRDLVAETLADEALLGGLEEAGVFGIDWLRTLGSLPNEYLHYYYDDRDAVAAITAQPATRGDYLHEQQHRFYETVAADPLVALDAWHRTRLDREATYMQEARADDEQRPSLEGGGYERVALDVMRAIAFDERATMIVNVRNGTVLPALPPDAVIEVPCLVDAAGAHPLATTAPGPTEVGLMLQMKGVEQLTIRAALERDRRLAFTALALHPLVPSTRLAGSLLEAYERNTPGLFS